ncbi:hypothetical protein ACFVZH_29495 [Streptomyces sp. NPDC059534]|uniref:hypothetical protein n=1 Tax=Streptomyces sp. NPDC059534 TaxID=3346859 RepID=UPI0036813B73
MDLCCNVYVDTGSPACLLETLSGIPGSVPSGPHGVSFAALSVLSVPSVPSVHDDHGTDRAEPSDFARWSTVLACASRRGASQDEVIATMADILEALWGAGFGAVAACEYQERLPRADLVEVSGGRGPG